MIIFFFDRILKETNELPDAEKIKFSTANEGKSTKGILFYHNPYHVLYIMHIVYFADGFFHIVKALFKKRCHVLKAQWRKLSCLVKFVTVTH